ncbi:uncharacterized protein O3C94_016600 [Discoglossus pictus]
MSSYEISRFLQRCQKEREDALRREESARNKLQHLEASTRSQIQELKRRLKEVTSESKAQQKTIKKLRAELGLEVNPKFKGKTIKDIIKELKEQEDQVARLREDNHQLSMQIQKIIPELALTRTQKLKLEVQLEAKEHKLQDTLKESSQVSKLLQESQQERQELERVYLMLKKSIEEAKQLSHRSIQTTTSIPVTLQTTYKRPSRDTPNSRVGLERRKAS